MELVVTSIKPEYREAKTKYGVNYVLDQYRVDYVLYLSNGTDVQGQKVLPKSSTIDLDQVKAEIVQTLKKTFLEGEA